MKNGVKTCTEPLDPTAIYMRNMYHTFFWGPFANSDEVVDALNHLDKADPSWDYNPFCVIYGANPLPSDFVFGFKQVPREIGDEIFRRRKRDSF